MDENYADLAFLAYMLAQAESLLYLPGTGSKRHWSLCNIKSNLTSCEGAIMDENNADLALLANMLTRVESLLHNLVQVARGIGLFVSSNKT